MKYRKKPVVIEAYQTDKELDIETLEGTMHASVGDYIITGVRGEKYPCKPDIFEQTYEPADASASPWHRVEDGLPDKYTQCLLADADGKCAVGYYRYDCKAWDNPAFGWIEMENRIYIDDMPMGIGKVVAWMPIEPPEEEA